VYKLVQTVLENTGVDYELVSLRKKTISGCIACLGCVKDNVCKVEDDLTPLREKIVAAMLMCSAHPTTTPPSMPPPMPCMERWFQFRHQTGNLLWGKLAVAVGVGGTSGRFPADEMEKFFLYNFIETVAKVTGQGAASCYSCGYGETCQVGIPSMIHGEGVKITPDMIPDVTKQPKVMAAAVEAGKRLGQRLKNGHDRTVGHREHAEEDDGDV
jgi:multimeric flavodoxin WrbA